jgi:Icc-related predicted phosphoesterase
MKIIAISDTHNKLDQISVPNGDILIHAGDATGRGMEHEVEEFNEQMGHLPHPIKIFIPGNHDFMFEQEENQARALLTNITHCLIDESVTVEGIKFYGSPWTPWFHSWAYNLPRGEAIREKWDLIPQDTDVLITHGPPHLIRDMVPRPWTLAVENVGCEELREAVFRIKPKVHVFGHIHEGRGFTKIEETLFINASCLDGSYLPINKPYVIEVENGKSTIIKGNAS